MMRDLAISLMSMFVIEPFESAMNERLAAAGAPREIVQQVGACARTALPLLAERGLAEPMWGATTVARVWLGATTADAVLGEADPSCRAAMLAARPFLGGAGA